MSASSEAVLIRRYILYQVLNYLIDCDSFMSLIFTIIETNRLLILGMPRINNNLLDSQTEYVTFVKGDYRPRELISHTYKKILELSLQKAQQGIYAIGE